MTLDQALRRIFREQEAAGFTGVAGVRLHYSLPLRENVLNAILAEMSGVPNLRLNVVKGGVEVKGLPVISSLTFQLPERIDFPDDPILRLTPRGFLGRLVGTALAAFNLAPDFVRVEGGQLRVDIGRLMASMGHQNILPLLRPVRLNALPGVLWLDGEING